MTAFTDKELKEIIKRNPGSLLNQAYLLGRKEANIELSAAIEKGKVAVPAR